MGSESTIMIRDAVHFNSALSKQGILERMFSFWFDHFVYNQIWEDPRVDMEALELNHESHILTIASGGCNILNYLTAQPAAIHAVDLNRNHLQLTKLKITALQHLPSYEAFLDFFGYADKESNIQNYHQYIRPHLDKEAIELWEKGSLFSKPRIECFKHNLYNYGMMGYFIRFVHGLAKCFHLSPEQLLHIKDSKEREELFERLYSPFFDHWSVRAIGKFPFLFYCLGIPPQQFEEMKKECGGKMNRLYLDRVKRLACQFPIEDNYFAWQAFSRRYNCEDQNALPDYLKRCHYETIRGQLDKITLNLISTGGFLKNQPDKSLDRFVFLDSQDWMDAKAIMDLWTQIERVGKPGSRIIFRTASWESPIERSLPAELMKKFRYEEERSKLWLQQDRSAIYGGFHLYILNK